MDNPESRPLPGTEGVASPFFSPDGQWLGFFAQNKLQKISVSGGSPVTIANIVGNYPGGATWAADDTIVFQDSFLGDLWRVTAAAGEPQHLKNTVNPQKGLIANRWPQFLPGVEEVLFAAESSAARWANPQLGIYSLTTGERRDLPHGGTFPHYSPTGHLIYVQNGTMMAAPFLKTPLNESAARFSPDGRWLAYRSTESGRPEIYVQPFPGPGGKWQISTDGGGEPVWNPNGRELFYRNGNKMMAVEVNQSRDSNGAVSFAAGKPRLLFEGQYAPPPTTSPNYDVPPDGQRFLMLKASQQQAATQIHVVLNWFDELKRRVPVAR